MKTIFPLFLCFFVVINLACQNETAAVDEALDSAAETVTEAAQDVVDTVTGADPNARVFFDFPKDGATIATTTNFLMGHENVEIVPAGDMTDGTGHFHILINTDFIAPGEVIPSDEQHLHFGTGAREAELTLPAGTHTLRLQLADGAHRGLIGDNYRDTITITVE